MRYAIRAGDRDLAIEVTPEGRFLVGDRVVAADLVEAVPGRVWSVVIDGEAHEVAFLAADRAWVDGDELHLEIADERAVAAGRAGGRSASARQEIRAPMPGLLKRVHVTEGAAVNEGDALVTLEAMKMENELRAAHAGTVAQIAVAEGTKVEGGALLIVIHSQ
ncbi:MAG: biotin/lipoyl-binding protein [Chloroflexota bacterium]|nr:biotin/lipoyl-binding protein [Chloroflexota bacterium]